MTLEETRKVLTLLKVNYRNSFTNYSKAESEALLSLWAETFKNIPAKAVLTAVNDIIKYDDREFAPNVGQVMTRIKETVAPDPTAEASQAFDDVRRFVREVGCDYVREHYEELPEIVRRIYSVDGIRNLGMNSPENNENFEKPRFVKEYKRLKQQRDMQLLSEGKIDQIAGIEHKQQLEIGG